MRVPGLLTGPDAGVSKPSLVTAENFAETGAVCGKRGWYEIAARASVGSGAGLAFCDTPLSALPVGRSSAAALDAVRPGRAEGPIWPGYGRTLAEAAAIEAAGRAERLVPAIMRVPALLTVLDAVVSRPSVVTAESFAETGAVCGKRGWYGLAARASAGSGAGLVLCAAPLSALPVGRSSSAALDAVRLGRAGRTLAEAAIPAVAFARSGFATASAVEAAGRAERLVPAIMRVPGLLTEPDAGVSKLSLVTAANLTETGDGCAGCGWNEIAARASVGSGAGLAFCATPLATFPMGRFCPVALDAVRLGRAEGPIWPESGRTLAEASTVEAAGRAERLVPAIMRVPGLLTEPDAGVSKPSLVTAENFAENPTPLSAGAADSPGFWT